MASDQDHEGIPHLGRAVRDTQQTVRHTADRVGELRTELGGRIDQLDGKVDELAVSGARVEGKVDVLIEEVAAVRHVRISAVQASIEVEKTGEIARVNEAVAVRADRRQALIKAIAVVGPVLAALITLAASKC